MRVLTVGSLFSGVGGIELGLEMTSGFRTIWQVENDPYASRVLAKHWPDAARYGDVREVHAAEFCPVADAIETRSGMEELRGGGQRRQSTEPRQPALVSQGDWTDSAEGLGASYPAGTCPNCLSPVDLLCGGFPCQDVSLAGTRAGLDGERSTLWSEFARLIRELRPRWVLAENVPGLLSANDGRFFGRVLGDLAEAGYSAEWGVLSAESVGAPHRRERVFIVAHAGSAERRTWTAEGYDLRRQHSLQRESQGSDRTAQRCATLAQSKVARLEGRQNGRHAGPLIAGPGQGRGAVGGNWLTEPDVGRVADGVPARVDRLRCLGNAVVPQVAKVIGRMILDAEMQL